MYRQKPEPKVTRLVGGGGGNPKPIFWAGSSVAEPASVTSGWTQHTRVPTVSDSYDPQSSFTPIAGGLQLNHPGTYEIEGMIVISGGAASVRYGGGIMTVGDSAPTVPSLTSTPYASDLSQLAGTAGSYCNTKTTVIVKNSPVQIIFRDYCQTTTSHTAQLVRVHAVRVIQGAPGVKGDKGDKGDTGNTGPKGTRWGTIATWPFADNTDIPAVMQDGGMPVVGDWVMCTNGFAIGQVHNVTAVYPSGNVDVPVGPIADLRGPTGTRWGTVNVSFPGGAGATLAGVTVSYTDGGGYPKQGDIVQNMHPDHIGDVYYISTPTYASFVSEIKKFTPPLNIRGATGPAGSALSHWPVNSVYISYDSANPAALFGGTWVAIGTGRMLIGVDPADATMDVAGDTGGSKTHTIVAANLPPHAHTINHDHGNGTVSIQYGTTTATGGTATRVTDVANTTGGTGTAVTAQISLPAYNGNSGNGPGTSTAINHLPPFLAVYMWRRTA